MATLAVTGAPPFSLFLSEFTILRAGFSAGHLVLSILFIAFLVAIFSGFLIHIANLVLGSDSGRPPAETCRWKKYSVTSLAFVVIAVGFWIPAPLFRLIQTAADIVTRP